MDDVTSKQPQESGNGGNEGNGRGMRRGWIYVAVGAFLLLLGAFELLAGTAAGLQPLNDILSFKTIGLHYAALKQLVDQHHVLAAAGFVAAYGTLGLFLLPGSALMVVASGLLFGAVLGIPLSSIGSALAASLGFGTARLVLGGPVARLHLAAIEKLKAGFQRHALSYMMFLRLTPGLPFAVINAAPALLGVRYTTFLIGTVVGLLPSRIALATAGAGLGKAIAIENEAYSQCLASHPAGGNACGYNIHVASLLTTETIAAFFGLALVALMPAILDYGSRLRRR